MSTIGPAEALRERIAARRAAMAQPQAAAPSGGLRDRIAARRAALSAAPAQQAPSRQGIGAYFPRPQQAAPVRAAGMPGMAPAGVDPQLLAQQDQIAREQFNYPGGDMVLGLARGFPVMERQAGGAMAAVGNFLPGQLGRGLVRAGTDGGGVIAGQLNELPEPQSFGGQLMESVPGMAGSIGVGLATAGAGPVLALGAGALSAGAQQGGGQFADSYDRTMATQAASPEQAANIAGTQGIMSGAVSALTSVLPMGQYLGKVAPNAVSKITARIMGDRLASRLLVAAAAEGSQEATEQVGQMVAQYLAEDDPAAFENWKQQIALAAAGGAILGPAGEGFASVMARGAQANAVSRNPAQSRDVASGRPVGRAATGMESSTVQPPPARTLETGVPPMVGNQGAPAGTQPGDVAVDPSAPLMDDLRADWEQQATRDDDAANAYIERLWDELSGPEQVAAEKADAAVMPGATGQVAPPVPGVAEDDQSDAAAEVQGSPEGLGTSAAPVQVSAGQSLGGDRPSQAGDESGQGRLQSGPLQNSSGPRGRTLSTDGMSNLRRKMLERRQALRASSQARQMQAEQDATIGRQVAPVDRAAADAIGEAYAPEVTPEVAPQVPDAGKKVGAKSPKTVAQMTKAEREAEAERLAADPVMHTPLITEGAISPTQINRMGNREKAKWQENGQRKMRNQARIRELRQTDEQIKASTDAAAAEEARKEETGARSRYTFLKGLEPHGFRGIKGSKKAYRAEFEALKARFEPPTPTPVAAQTSTSPPVIGAQSSERESGGGTKKPWEMTRAEFVKANTELRGGEFMGGAKSVPTRPASQIKAELDAMDKETHPRAKAYFAAQDKFYRTKKGTFLRDDEVEAWAESRRTKRQELQGELQNATAYERGVAGLPNDHRRWLSFALSEGKPVPASVLADYPDLANRQATPDSSPKSELPPVASMDRAALVAELGGTKNHVAVYGGKAVAIDYASEGADEFRVAAQRVSDNAGEGHVVTPSGEVYAITKGSRKAKPVAEAERDRVRAEAGWKPAPVGTVKKLRETVEARRRQMQTPSAPAVAEATSSTPQEDAGRARSGRVRQEKSKAAEAATAPDTRESESPSPKSTATPGDTQRNAIERFKVGDKVRIRNGPEVFTVTEVQTRATRDEVEAERIRSAQLSAAFEGVDAGAKETEPPYLRNYTLSGPKSRDNTKGLYSADDAMLSRADDATPATGEMYEGDHIEALTPGGGMFSGEVTKTGLPGGYVYIIPDGAKNAVTATPHRLLKGGKARERAEAERVRLAKQEAESEASRKAVDAEMAKPVPATVTAAAAEWGLTVERYEMGMYANKYVVWKITDPKGWDANSKGGGYSNDGTAQSALDAIRAAAIKRGWLEPASGRVGAYTKTKAGKQRIESAKSKKAEATPATGAEAAKARASLAPKQQALSDKLGAERKTLEAMGNVPAEHKAQIVSVEEAAKRAPAAASVVDERTVSSGAPSTKGEIGDRTRKLRDFIREVPEFALDPHFIVAKVQDGRAVLRFQDGGRYSFAADAIGISFEVPPTVGQRVEIDIKAVKAMKHGESWIIAEPTGKAPSAAVKTEMAQRAGIDAADVGAEGSTSKAKRLIGWANQTEADARAKLRDKAKKQKGKMSSGIDPIEQAETAYQIGRWAAALVVRGGVKVAQAVYSIAGKVGPVPLRARKAAEAITNQIIEAAGKDPTDDALTRAARDVEAEHLDNQAARLERLAKSEESTAAAGTDPEGRYKAAAEARQQAAELRAQADKVRATPKPEKAPKPAKTDERPASVKASRQRVILTAAVAAAYKAAKQIQGGGKVGKVRLGKMVDEVIARQPWMKSERAGILRAARALLKDAGNDPAKVTDAHAAAMKELSERVAAWKEAKKARGALVAEMFKDSPDNQISGRAAMKERLRATGKVMTRMQTQGAKAVAAAIRQTKQAGRAEAAKKVADLRTKIKAEQKRRVSMYRIEMRGAVDAAKDAARDKAAVEAGIRAQLVTLIRENMPRELRGKYLTAVRDTRTLGRLAIEAAKLERDLLEHMAKQQIRQAEKAAGTASKRMELEPELRDQLNAAVGQLQTLKRRLRAVKDGGGSLTAAVGSTENASTQRITADDLRVLLDDIENAARAILSARFQQKNLDAVRIKGELVAAKEIREGMGTVLEAAADLPRSGTKTVEAGWLLRKLRRRTNWDSMMQMLDGGLRSGPFRRLFGEVEKGRNDALELHHQFQDLMGEIVQRHGYESSSKMLAEVSASLGENLQKTARANIGGEPMTMTLGQAMYLYASSEDTGFLARIRKGQKIQFKTQRTSDPISITEDDLASVAQALTPAQRAMVDELKAAYDRHYFQKLSTVNKRLKGVFLEKVPGYWGIKLNRDFSEMRGTPTTWRGNYIAAMEEAGYMQERLGPSKTPILIGDFGMDILTRSKSASTTIGKAERVKLLMQTLMHPDVVKLITDKYGAETIERLKRRVAEWSGGTTYSPIGRVWKELLSMWARAKTQLRFPTWLRNAVGGSSRMLNELGAVDVAATAFRPSVGAYKELLRYSPAARERWAGGSAGNFYDATGEDFADAALKDASTATIRNLAGIAKAAVTLDKDAAAASAAGAWRSWKKTLDAITVGNYFDAHGAVVAYNVFLSKAPKDWSESKRKTWAARKAMRAFERTGNTAILEYANDVQLDARENMWIGMMSTFTGDTAKAMNMVYQSYARAQAGEISWGKAFKTIGVLLFGSALSGLVSAAWAAMLGKGYDKAQSAAGNRFMQEVGSLVPMGGGVVTSAIMKTVNRNNLPADSVLDVPMMDLIDAGARMSYELVKAMDAPTRKVRKNTVTASERYVRALMASSRLADAVGIPSQYVFDAKVAIDNWSK